MTTALVFVIAAFAVLLWDTNERTRRAISALDAVDLRLAAAIRRLARRQTALEKRRPEQRTITREVSESVAASPADAALGMRTEDAPGP